MADYWMKLYIEILDDPKMATLPDRVWRRVIELFLVAKRINKDGHLPDTRQIAWMLRMNPDELESDMAQISHTGVVVREVNGWFIPKFAQRQAAVPDAERKSQQRGREKSQQYYGDVTDLSRSVTQSTEDREQKTESETETEAESDAAFDGAVSVIQSAIGIPPKTPGDIQAVNEILKMGAIEADMLGGIAWLKSENVLIRYYKTLVGPIREAMRRRVQGVNGSQNKQQPAGVMRVGPDGEEKWFPY